MVCKQACCDFHSDTNLEEEATDLSGDESERLCEVCVCVCLLLSLL